MLWILGTIAICVVAAELVIRYGPDGWRTRISMWGAAAITTLAGVLQGLGAVDWSKLIDSQKVAYGVSVAIPIIAARLREITAKPPGTA